MEEGEDGDHSQSFPWPLVYQWNSQDMEFKVLAACFPNFTAVENANCSLCLKRSHHSPYLCLTPQCEVSASELEVVLTRSVSCGPKKGEEQLASCGFPTQLSALFQRLFPAFSLPFSGHMASEALAVRGPSHKPTGLGRSEQGQDNISLNDQNFLLQTNTLPLWTAEKIRVWIGREIVSLRNCGLPFRNSWLARNLI